MTINAKISSVVDKTTVKSVTAASGPKVITAAKGNTDMGVTIKITKNPSKISTAATLNNSDSAVILKNEKPAISYDRLDALKDVVEGQMPANGATLVYDQATDKYEVKQLSLSDITADLDGGSF